VAPTAAHSRPRVARLAGFLLAAAILPGLSGCRREPVAAPLPPPDQTYTTRGRVEVLPSPSDSSIRIMHERIPDFVSSQGQVVGMNAMQMPFEPAKGLSLEGIEVGDPVEFTFEVRWKTRPHSLLVAIEKLSPETRLDFSRAKAGDPEGR
jgi:hypothetical protein